MLTAPSAQAGKFVVSYTGTFTAPNAAPQSNVSSGYSPALGTVTLSVTPVFTWVKDAPQDTSIAPPTFSYIETEAASVSIFDVSPSPNQGLTTTAGPTASDGSMSDSQKSYSAPQYGVGISGTHVVNNQSSGQSRTLTATYNEKGTDSTGGSASTASYTAYPVYVTLAGQDPATNKALTGQQITATLAMPNSLPSGTKITSYTWSFTGGTKGNPIKGWDGNGVAVDGTTSQQLFPFLNADLSQTDTTGNGISVNSISFYDEIDKDAVTVKCAVSLTFPDGTTGSINASSIPVTFMKPTAVWNTHPNDPPSGAVFDQTQMGYIEQWDATITVPAPFSGGSGCFAQIVTPTINFQRKPTGSQSINCYLKVPQQNPDGTTTYVLPTSGLDTVFPYGIGPPPTYAFNPKGYIWDVSNTGSSADTPFVKFSVPAADDGGNLWYSAFDSDTFTTWLMYMPPKSPTGPGGTIWVPLQRVDWHWTGNVVKDNATGLWNAAQSGSSPVTGSTSSPGLTTDTPPQWTNVISIQSNVLYP